MASSPPSTKRAKPNEADDGGDNAATEPAIAAAAAVSAEVTEDRAILSDVGIVGRKRRASAQPKIEIPEEWEPVSYSPSPTPLGGSERMVVTLSHKALGRAADSTADPQRPAIMLKLRKLCKDAGLGTDFFKAGHMLSGQLGGVGDSDENLIVLTPSGNKRHSKYEQRIVSTLEQMGRVYRDMELHAVSLDQRVCFGLYYKLLRFNEEGQEREGMLEHVSTHIEINLQVKGYDYQTKDEIKLSDNRFKVYIDKLKSVRKFIIDFDQDSWKFSDKFENKLEQDEINALVNTMRG